MAFSNKALATLEFDKIKEMLAASCATDGAKAKAKALMPASDYETAKRRLTVAAPAP